MARDLKKKIVRLIAVGVMFVVGFTLVGASFAVAQKQEVRFWSWWSGTAGKMFMDMTEDFSKAHPNIKVEHGFYGPAGTVLLEKLTTSIAAGVPPESAILMESFAPRLIKSGYVVPVEEFIEGPEGWTEEEFQDFNPELWKPFVYAGKLSFVPYRLESSMVAYNKDLLKSIGVTSLPQTWEEFASVSERLTKDFDGDGMMDQWGTIVPHAWTWVWAPFLWGNGGDFFTEDYSEATFNSPEAVEALQFWVDLVYKYKAAPAKALDLDWLSGRVGSTVMGDWTPSNWDETVPFDYTGAFWPYPEDKGPNLARALAKLNVLAIFKTTPEKEKATWKFIKWMVSPENLVRYLILRTGSPTPVRYSVAQNPEFVEWLEKNPIYKIFTENVNGMKLTPLSAAWAPIDYNIVRPAIDKALFLKATPKEALDEAVEKANEEIRKVK